MITGHTQVFALLGTPVAHSQSPAMHNQWFREADLDAVYVALDVQPSSPLEPLLHCLDGANLTIPHKLAIVPILDEAGPDVLATGAANAVVRRDGRLIGRNTDVEGFGRAADELGVGLQGGHAVILGAGGAGRAVALALARRGVARVTWLNRTLERVTAAAHELGLEAIVAPGELTADRFDQAATDAVLVVNATSGAGGAAIRAFEVAGLPAGAGWIDLNYWMDEPPCLSAARERGLKTQTGHRMLVHQGALAFELFTGRLPSHLELPSS